MVVAHEFRKSKMAVSLISRPFTCQSDVTDANGALVLADTKTTRIHHAREVQRIQMYSVCILKRPLNSNRIFVIEHEIVDSSPCVIRPSPCCRGCNSKWCFQ